MTKEQLQIKVDKLEQTNAKMFDAIISLGEQITHFEKVIEQLRKENELLRGKPY